MNYASSLSFIIFILGRLFAIHRKKQAFRGSAFRLHSFGTSPPQKATVITAPSFKKNLESDFQRRGCPSNPCRLFALYVLVQRKW